MDEHRLPCPQMRANENASFRAQKCRRAATTAARNQHFFSRPFLEAFPPYVAAATAMTRAATPDTCRTRFRAASIADTGLPLFDLRKQSRLLDAN
ncbi:hypothetical protein AYM40_31570 [Paraburkholderia phytofirmans OLGA172]|uniref:Uncharacterized protein n=1 Tax=Paraburkholderia phytofirmans OLGA172 TaxID=1417228 RepID=A0A160FUE5_9BURK|nr:hypothetical protein AYM40_31570 [Paraburkholderia phytofirmans OLGA172]